MHIIGPILLFLGIVVLGILVYRIGGGPILETLAQLTWWQFVIICLPYALGTVVDTLGWRFAFARDQAPFLRLLGARLAGEALNVVTAVGSVGGEAVKAWLVRRDVSYAESVPSVIIAKTTITSAQALFLLLGIVLAWTMRSVDAEIVRSMLWLLVVEVVAVGGFIGAQVAGLVHRGGKLLVWVGLLTNASGAEQLDEALRGYYRYDWRAPMLPPLQRSASARVPDWRSASRGGRARWSGSYWESSCCSRCGRGRRAHRTGSAASPPRSRNGDNRRMFRDSALPEALHRTR